MNRQVCDFSDPDCLYHGRPYSTTAPPYGGTRSQRQPVNFENSNNALMDFQVELMELGRRNREVLRRAREEMESMGVRSPRLATRNSFADMSLHDDGRASSQNHVQANGTPPPTSQGVSDPRNAALEANTAALEANTAALEEHTAALEEHTAALERHAEASEAQWAVRRATRFRQGRPPYSGRYQDYEVL